MTDKITKSILLASMIVFISMLTIILGSLYSYFTGVQLNQLKIETDLAAQGVTLSGTDYLSAFDSESYRITWIGPDGTVLYDNMALSGGMENHLKRQEIREALREGYGESKRYSSTLSERLLYTAKLLPDGSIIRLSHTQNTVWALIFGFSQPICFIILSAMLLSFLLATRLSKIITSPINKIDPDRPQDYIGKEEYAEIEPLLIRMSQQQYKIKTDKEELKKASQIRQEFTANVSHELKTPLHVIAGYAELLEQGLVREEDIGSFAGKIRAESHRVTKLVEDIIDLTQLDGDGQGLERETLDLLAIAENAVNDLKTEAMDRQIEVSLSGTSGRMTGISQVLYSIVYNLCDNAIKYNKAGGHVWMCVKDLPLSVDLTVTDDGIGISKEHQERIFERFYRVDKSRSKEAGGTGLGLSIVKHGVLTHKGTIRMKSEPGKGSEFTVSFPKVSQDAIDPVSDSAGAPT